MAYVTRCPYCGAVWLLPSKDTAERAPVKCSKCAKCFDATRDMIEVSDSLFPGFKPEPAAAPQDVVAPSTTPTAVPAEPLHPDATQPASTPAEASTTTVASVAAGQVPLASTTTSQVPRSIPLNVSENTQRQFDKLNDLMSDFSGRMEPSVGSTSPSTTKTIIPTPSIKPPFETPGVSMRRAKKHSSAPGTILAGVLILGILAIAAVLFNQKVIELFPQTKATYENLCTKITCPGFYLKNIEAFAITKAQLTNSGAPGSYSLEVTILNGSQTAQAVPHLSLQLVDENDAEIAKRILTPADFLADPTVKSLAAGRTLTITVNMRTNTTPSRCVATPIYP